jgi:hypothetical protein
MFLVIFQITVIVLWLMLGLITLIKSKIDHIDYILLWIPFMINLILDTARTWCDVLL